MLLTYLVLVLCGFAYGQLPSYITLCQKSTNLGDCIKENIKAVQPNMGEGVPELYLKPLNPWVSPSIKMKIPTLKLDIYDVQVWGMDTTVVKGIKINLKRGIIDIKYNIPYFWGEAKYDIDGNLFMFQVDAKGYSNGSITDADITLRLRAKPKVVDGKKYMKIKKSRFSWKINGGATVYFKDIFPGNPFLSNNFNRVLSTRAVEFYYIIQPIMEFMVTEWVENSFKGVFSNYSLDELFAQ